MLVFDDYPIAFLHPMKTGGTWVRAALSAAGVRWHDDGADWHEQRRPDGCSAFTLVRNPLSWYASFWAYRQEHGWGGNLVIGHGNYAQGSFPLFVATVAHGYPGFLTEYLDNYLKACVGGPQYPVWIKNEELADGLVRYLKNMSVRFDEDALRATPRKNASKERPYVDPVTASVIVRSEMEAFVRFKYDWSAAR